MDRFHADLSQLDKLDMTQLRPLPSPLRSRRRLPPNDADALATAVKFGKELPGSPSSLALIDELIQATRKPPALTITPPAPPIRPGTPTIGLTPTSARTLTMAVGAETNLVYVVGFTGQFGVYGCIRPGELGVYSSIGGGLWTNVGVSVGPTITFIFGPPSDFAGVSLGIGADGGPGVLSVGAMLLFSLPPTRFLGFSISLAVGESVWPAAITVQVGATRKKPYLTSP